MKKERNPSLPFDESLAERVRGVLSRRKNLQEKKMFGGLGFLLKGNMYCGVWKEFLILRLGLDQAEQALLEPHVKPFDITGKAMKGWVMIEPEGVKEEAKLKDWLEKTHKFVNTLPAK